VIGLLARGEKPNVPQNISSNCFQFISACLEINPDSRPSASELLEYEFLTQLKVNSDRVLNKRGRFFMG
jgi:serine/threonine protein kinase